MIENMINYYFLTRITVQGRYKFKDGSIQYGGKNLNFLLYQQMIDIKRPVAYDGQIFIAVANQFPASKRYSPHEASSINVLLIKCCIDGMLVFNLHQGLFWRRALIYQISEV